MSDLSPGAVERCKLLRASLLTGSQTRQELKSDTQMSSNDLSSAILRCRRAHMITLVYRDDEPAQYALTNFGHRVAIKDEEEEIQTTERTL